MAWLLQGNAETLEDATIIISTTGTLVGVPCRLAITIASAVARTRVGVTFECMHTDIHRHGGRLSY